MNAIGTLNTIGTLGNGMACLNKQKDCSTQSIVKALDNFMTAMHNMRNVVMVPSRLKDLSVSLESPIPLNSKTGALVPAAQTSKSVDLFSCYRMLHTVNDELVNGGSRDEDSSPVVCNGKPTPKKPVRNPSLKIAAETILASRSNASSESSEDSGCSSDAEKDDDEKLVIIDTKPDPEEEEETVEDEDQSTTISKAFRTHLQGLFGILHQLTDTANYLTKKYQDDVETSQGEKF